MAVPPILIVDDEPHARTALTATMAVLGLPAAIGCASLDEARHALATSAFSLVLLDLVLTDGSGETLLAEIAARHPGLPVIIVTGTDEVACAVRCMRAHAIDYLVKPVGPTELEIAVRAALAGRALESENRQLAGLVRSEGLHHPEAFAGILTMDPAMFRLMQYAEVVAPGDRAALVSGEDGTGKKALAGAIHRLSGRRGGLVALDVSGLDDTAFADTLFGHRRGAFPGATGERLGLVQQAEGGTLLLDGLCRLGEASQVRLLRLIEDGLYYPLGADQPRRSSARIIAITTCDPDAEARGGRLRQDLYHRLLAHHLALPPLRQRCGDIPVLLHHAVATAADDLGLSRPAVSPEAVQAAQANPWPGNVRELLATVRDAVGRGRGLGLDPRLLGPQPRDPAGRFPFPAVLPTLDAMRDLLVTEALRRSDGDLVEASRLLGMSRWGLSKRLRQVRPEGAPD